MRHRTFPTRSAGIASSTLTLVKSRSGRNQYHDPTINTRTTAIATFFPRLHLDLLNFAAQERRRSALVYNPSQPGPMEREDGRRGQDNRTKRKADLIKPRRPLHSAEPAVRHGSPVRLHPSTVVFGWTRLANRSYEMPFSAREFHPAAQVLSPERTRVSLSLFVRYNPGTCKQSTKPQVVATGC